MYILYLYTIYCIIYIYSIYIVYTIYYIRIYIMYIYILCLCICMYVSTKPRQYISPVLHILLRKVLKISSMAQFQKALTLLYETFCCCAIASIQQQPRLSLCS